MSKFAIVLETVIEAEDLFAAAVLAAQLKKAFHFKGARFVVISKPEGADTFCGQVLERHPVRDR